MDTKSPCKARRPITTTEIARLSGVSRSTVSAVLNGKSGVRESTRRKVLECIRRQNYESGIIARTLVSELSHMVAVLISNAGSPYDSMVFQGISDVLDAEGYQMLVHRVRLEDPQAIENLHAYRPAGYIALCGAEGMGGEYARRILDQGIPLVGQGRLAGVETHRVDFDVRTGMKLGTDYVIGRGHRRLGHLAGPAHSQGARERKLGFVESLIEHDIPVTDAVILDMGGSAALGYHGALEMLRDPETRPTAVICFNDITAFGVYRAAHELSLSIPEDVSVVGFDGIEFGELLGPPLTTVDISPREGGRRAAELLLRVVRNEVGRATVTEWIEPKLLERGSVRHM